MSRDIRIPEFQEPNLTKFLTELIAYIDRVDDSKMSRITTNNSLLITSPNHSVYEVKVTDAGALTVTKIQGG